MSCVLTRLGAVLSLVAGLSLAPAGCIGSPQPEPPTQGDRDASAGGRFDGAVPGLDAGAAAADAGAPVDAGADAAGSLDGGGTGDAGPPGPVITPPLPIPPELPRPSPSPLPVPHPLDAGRR